MASTSGELDLAEAELDFAGLDGVFHLAGQPGVRSFGDVFPLYLRRNVLASQRVFEAAARDGVRVVFASSSSVYGAAERFPTPEDDAAAAALAVRDHEARVRAPRRRRTRARSASTASCCATSTPSARASGPTWRSPGSRSPSPRGRASSSTATATSRAAGRTSATWSTRRSARWRGGTGTYNVGGALEASMNEAIELSSASRAARSTSGAPARCPATSGARAPTRRRIRAELGWEPDGLARGRSRAPSGNGPRLESPLDERPLRLADPDAEREIDLGAGAAPSSRCGGSPWSAWSSAASSAASLLAQRRERLQGRGADRAGSGRLAGRQPSCYGYLLEPACDRADHVLGLGPVGRRAIRGAGRRGAARARVRRPGRLGDRAGATRATPLVSLNVRGASPKKTCRRGERDRGTGRQARRRRRTSSTIRSRRTALS